MRQHPKWDTKQILTNLHFLKKGRITSAVRHTSPSSWISKNKDDLESQGDDLSKSLGSHASKNRFYRWNLPLKVTDKTSHFSLIWGGGYRNKSLSKSLGAAVFLSFGSSGGPLGPLGLLDEQKRSRWRLRIQNSENVPFWVYPPVQICRYSKDPQMLIASPRYYTMS